MPTALLLPGWGTSTERMEPLRDALRSAGLGAHAYAYTPVGSIERIAESLAQRVERMSADHGEIALIGHSLGGLIAASAVLDHGVSVASVTTINTPWRGTWAAWTAHPEDPLGRQLRWGASALRDLRRTLADHLDDVDGPRWTLLSAALDLAAPATTALRAPDGQRLTKRLIPVNGHSVSLLHPKLIDAVSDSVAGALV